jgi:cobalt-zinc-cadmium efflux system membrane fusion protein
MLGWGFMCLLLGTVACQRDSEPDPDAARPSIIDESGWLHLSPRIIERAGIETISASSGPFQVYRQFPATIQANENELAEVTTLVGGRVVDVSVDFGEDVGKGAVLAQLHSTDLGLVEAAYLKGQAKLHEANLAYKRATDLLEHKAISQADFLRREAEMKSARAEAREAGHRLELLGVSAREMLRLDREQTIRSDVAIRAPFAGRIISRNVTRGEIVDQHKRLFTIADLSEVWAVGSVPERDVQFIRKDQHVEVVAAAYPHAIFPGRITYIGDVLDPATRSMRLRVTVPNPDKVLKPEMFALVLVYGAPTPDVVTVPLVAVQSSGTGPIVFVRRNDDRFEPRAVTVGEESGEVIAILDGLKDGEQVVTKGAFVLKSEAEKHKIEPTQ